MSKKAVFLDRDGVINEDKGYVHRVEELVLLPGVIEGLKRLQTMGFMLFIVTNQSGIGRGYFTFEDFKRFQEELLGILEEKGIRIEKTYVCPHSPEESCGCRKPNTKHVEDAAAEYGIDLSASYVIGDHASDIELGKRAGLTTIHLLTGHGRKHGPVHEADHVAESFLDAVEWVEQIEKQKSA